MRYLRYIIFEWRGHLDGWQVSDGKYGTVRAGPYSLRSDAQKAIEEYALNNARQWEESCPNQPSFIHMQYENALRAHTIVEVSLPEDLES